MPTESTLERIYPFFIVKNLAESIDFYNQNTRADGFTIPVMNCSPGINGQRE